ncbi:MAG: ABC transporter permease, partial [Gammaproteobacteria bacterium]
MSSLRRMQAIASKEVRQLRRDRLTIGMVIGIPLLQILLFGYAINLDVRHLTAAVSDQSQTARSRALVAALQATQVVDVSHQADTAEALTDLMRAGTIT